MCWRGACSPFDPRSALNRLDDLTMQKIRNAESRSVAVSFHYLGRNLSMLAMHQPERAA